MLCFMSPMRSVASDTSIPCQTVRNMDKFPLGYYSGDQQCAWLDPFVKAIEIRASAECALLQAAGLPTTAWHECKGSLGPDVIQHIYSFLIPSEAQRDFLHAASVAAAEREAFNNYVKFADPGRDRYEGDVPASACNDRPITWRQKFRSEHGFVVAIELRVIRLKAHYRWDQERMRRINFDCRVQAHSVMTETVHKCLKCVSWCPSSAGMRPSLRRSFDVLRDRRRLLALASD